MSAQIKRVWIHVVFIALVVAATAIVWLALKNRRLREANDELAYYVNADCRGLATDLRLRAAEYAKGVEYLRQPGVTLQKRQGIEQFQFTSELTGDMTRSSRNVAGMALWHRFAFCLSVRAGEDAKRNALSDRFERARDELMRSEDHASLAHAVKEMAELAATVRDLPLRQERRPRP